MPICTECKAHFGNDSDLGRHKCGEPLQPLKKPSAKSMSAQQPSILEGLKLGSIQQ